MRGLTKSRELRASQDKGYVPAFVGGEQMKRLKDKLLFVLVATVIAAVHVQPFVAANCKGR